MLWYFYVPLCTRMRNVHCLQSGLVFSSFSLMQYDYGQNFQFPSKNYEVFLPFLNQRRSDSEALNSDFTNFQPMNEFYLDAYFYISPVLAEKGLIIFGQILKILVIVLQYTSDK